MKNFNSNTMNNDEWLTPPDVISALGVFDLDPCSPIKRPWDTAKKHYSILDDGLSQSWEGRVWLNPPYGREVFIWMDKLQKHRNGVALIFARTETRGFHNSVWNVADSVFFFKGRLNFHYVDGRKGGAANAPSCLVSYSQEDTQAIENACLQGKIQGKLVLLKYKNMLTSV